MLVDARLRIQIAMWPTLVFLAMAPRIAGAVGQPIVVWGSNGNGQGVVPPPNAGFVVVAAGSGHALGLKEDGSIVAWGYNSYESATSPRPMKDS